MRKRNYDYSLTVHHFSELIFLTLFISCLFVQVRVPVVHCNKFCNESVTKRFPVVIVYFQFHSIHWMKMCSNLSYQDYPVIVSQN